MLGVQYGLIVPNWIERVLKRIHWENVSIFVSPILLGDGR